MREGKSFAYRLLLCTDVLQVNRALGANFVTAITADTFAVVNVDLFPRALCRMNRTDLNAFSTGNADVLVDDRIWIVVFIYFGFELCGKQSAQKHMEDTVMFRQLKRCDKSVD